MKIQRSLVDILTELVKISNDLHKLWEINDRLYGNELKETTDEETADGQQSL
jgi:hypothetical protein